MALIQIAGAVYHFPVFPVLNRKKNMQICGVDEVGVASIAGPVMACAVIVDTEKKPLPGVTDSKKISKKKREKLVPIIENYVDGFSFGSLDVSQIEQMNIHYAKLEAMKIAVHSLLQKGFHIDKVIVDGGFTIPGLDVYQEAHPKADLNFWEVSAASILAKVKRDKIMEDFSKLDKYSYYDWESNAGYYSPNHRSGIVLHGPSDLHRKTFAYFKYCMFCHYELKNKDMDGENYINYLKSFGMHGHHKLWKQGEFNTWKPII